MSEFLLCVGLDVGTTTTQLIVSRLQVENRASSFAVPELEITGRDVFYESPVYFTPLTDASHVDGTALRELVLKTYADAGISRELVDTGAVIVTGETSRKENAGRVLDALSELAGDFVVATAGPHLESVLAAKGAGAVAYSRDTGKSVLHMDIGGGTSNLAWIVDGKILRTGCLNVGGRLLKLDKAGAVTYISPVLSGSWEGCIGETPDQQKLESLTELLTQALEMAAGLRPPTPLLEQLLTKEAGTPWIPPERPEVISFSGGVADCIDTRHPPLSFGDLGPLLGQTIKGSLLCRQTYRLGNHTIRATVIGAGCHSTQLSGSTVFYRGVALPVKNLPVAVFSEEEQDAPDFAERIAQRLQQSDADTMVLAIPGYSAPGYAQITALAEQIAKGCAGRDVLVCLEADMAKALGHSLCLRLPENAPCLCIDRVRLTEESYLDIGTPVGPALPVVVKTLVLSKGG